MNQKIDLRTPKGRNTFYKSIEWRALREWYLQSFPLCDKCLSKGILEDAVEVHHKNQLKMYPTMANALDPSSLQGLCSKCHGEETYNETLRGNNVFKLVNKMWKI
jgi:5-methylcytosine-specific restriction endonuclease McrA